MRAIRNGAERLGPCVVRRRSAVLLALVLSCACSRGAHSPNLVFITLDTTRADHLGLYGYFRDTSPNLDAFARQAIVFDRAIVPMATTLPTHTSLFTATHPLEHGVLANSTQGGARFVASERLRPLAAVAKAAGFHTAAFVSGAPVKRGSGIEEGFEQFDESPGRQRAGAETTAAALAWLKRTREGPFLLWVHYFDAHWPYFPPVDYASLFSSDEKLEELIAARRIPEMVYQPMTGQMQITRLTTNLYDGELRYQDDQLGTLLGALAARPDWNRTVVVIAGDHGEALGQHAEAGHGGTWDAQLHAPLLMRIPGEAPRRVATLVAAADVIPTLLAQVDLPAFSPLLAQASGRDVLTSAARSLPVLSQDTPRGSDGHDHRYALTTERWKLFRMERSGGAQMELFDLNADPFELTDVAAQHTEVVKELSAALDVALDAQKRKGADLHGGQAPVTKPADPETLEQLRQLGYLE